MISVVIPTFNRRAELGRAVGSVLAQESPGFELVVIDDGSEDGTEEYLRGIEDPRLRWFKQENRGRSAARNRGAALAQGEYLAFLDSDDELSPGWMAAVQSQFGSTSAGVVCVGVKIIDCVSGKVLLKMPRNLGPLYCRQVGGFVPPGAFAMQRSLFLAVNGYDERLVYSENTDLSLRIVDACLISGRTVSSIEEPLVVYHRQPLRWSKKPEFFRLQRESIRIMLEKHGKRFLECGAFEEYANYCAVAGVNAARLGLNKEARGHFARALRVCPVHWRSYLRYLLACLPTIGSLYWRRHAE